MARSTYLLEPLLLIWKSIFKVVEPSGVWFFINILKCYSELYIIYVMKLLASTGQRKESCPTGKAVVESNWSIQKELIQNSIKRIKTLLQRFTSLKYNKMQLDWNR